MPDFVRQYVGTGEITRRAKSILQLVEKTQIQIHQAVLRAVERTSRRFGRAAGRLNRIAEQHSPGWLVTAAEQLRPVVLHILHDGVDEVDLTFLSRRRRHLT